MPPRATGWRTLLDPSPLLACALVLLWCAWVRWLGLSGLDLSDLPGPAGVQYLALALDTRGLDPPFQAALLRRVIQLSGMDPLLAARLLMFLCNMAGVLGIMLAAGALGGPLAAASAGLVAGTWSMNLQLALLLGMDGPAAGLAWLGVGLAWWAPRLRGAGLLVGLAAGALLAVAVGIKTTAIPVLLFAGLLPFLGPRELHWRLAPLAAVLLGGLACHQLLGHTAHLEASVQQATPDLPGLLAGLERSLWPGARYSAPDGGLPELACLALLGLLVPGRAWRARALLLLLSLAILGGVAASLEAWYRLRYLVPASMGLLVLAGAGLGLLASMADRLGPLRWLLALVVTALLALDSLAFLHAWSDTRQEQVGTAPCALPRAPQAWARSWSGLGFDESQSAIGAAELVSIARRAPIAGLATVRLQDGREAHAMAGAELAGVPWTVLAPGACCQQGESGSACIQTVLDQLEAAGALLVLPRFRGDMHRVPREDLAWINQLRGLARAREPLQDSAHWWSTWQGSGPGAPLPCAQGGAMATR